LQAEPLPDADAALPRQGGCGAAVAAATPCGRDAVGALAHAHATDRRTPRSRKATRSRASARRSACRPEVPRRVRAASRPKANASG
jgi:hypothetical protein